MTNAFAQKQNLQIASRLPALTTAKSVSATEVILLIICGALSAVAVGMLHLRIGVPGHAILRGVLPMALGLALVPRRSAGMVMAAGAGLTSALMNLAHIGIFPPAALISVLALGPVIDVALLGKPQGWGLYGRFAIAGSVANLLAYAVKAATVQLGLEAAGGHQFAAFGSVALVSFVACGALAGLISAAVCFRLPSGGYPIDDLRRD
jgi:hypothetical protein